MQKIGVFDSGVGGLSILNELLKELPYEDFYYYGDSLNNPYGEKSDEELLKITSNIVEKLINKNCKLIVIACNTATTRCMKKLREIYSNVIFVGTVPAIKVACDKRFKNTLVMATPATIESERTYELIRDNKRYDQNIYLLPCPGLANAIEQNDKEKIKRILQNDFKDYKDKEIDGIMVQLPLPKHLNQKAIVNAIDENKDIDGLTDSNIIKLYNNNYTLAPCTPIGILKLLE